jgi:SAM-dependent methyltransferase
MASSFDRYASDYDAALARGIALSGEEKEYFARGRTACVAEWVRQLGRPIETVLDFGCGTGTSVPLLLEALRPRRVVGVDPSVESIGIARTRYGGGCCEFYTNEEYRPDGRIDLAFCNGVFHHIAPAERSTALRYVHAVLAPGGIFAFWENNPLNPGTRYVMSRIPFDHDAVRMRAGQARVLLRQGGFTVLRTEFLFVFPRLLKALRWMEPRLSRFPLGAQYGILCRKD